MRHPPAGSAWPIPVIQIQDISKDTDWSKALKDVEIVIHAAARAHVMRETVADPLSEFRKVNVDGTVNLARQAAANGAKRFIFLSSIKVNGETTTLGHPFKADDIPAPIDPYGISKHEAEQALIEIGRKTGMELVIIRPPLVYGPGVKANFHNMMRWLSKGIPLPLGAIRNKRSFVALPNLIDLIVTCIDHPKAAGHIFLVSDDEDLSTPELLRRMGRSLGHPAHLISVPPILLDLGARITGKPEMAQRLCASLQLDISKTRTILGWTPPVAVNIALKETAVAFSNK